MLPFQEWQDWCLALFDSAAGFDEARGGPEVFDGAFESGDGAGASACGYVNFREIQVKLRLFALQLQGGLAQVRGFIPLFFGARYRQAEKRKVVWILAFDFDSLAQVGESVFRVTVLQQFDTVFKLDQRITFFHSCTSLISGRLEGPEGLERGLAKRLAVTTSVEKSDDKNYWSGGQVGSGRDSRMFVGGGVARVRIPAGARRIR